MLDSQLLFFFGALGAFNAFLLAVYLLAFKKGRSSSDFILSTLLVLLAIRVGVSCVYYFGPVNEQLIKAGQVANLLLGPTLFFLFKSQKKCRIQGKDYLHVSALVLAIAFLWVLFDFNTWDRPIRFSLHTALSIYFIAIIIRWRRLIGSVLRNEGSNKDEVRTVIVFLSVVFTCIGFATSLVSNYILGPLIFSFILYISFGSIVRSERIQKPSYNQKKITNPEYEKLWSKLRILMEEEELYRDPDLKLDILAGHLSVSKHLLSQLLNDNLKKSFNNFVNEYRVEAACEMLSKDQPFSIEAIGYEVGFHSRSSFFSTFKKFKQTTPAQFKALS